MLLNTLMYSEDFDGDADGDLASGIAGESFHVDHKQFLYQNYETLLLVVFDVTDGVEFDELVVEHRLAATLLMVGLTEAGVLHRRKHDGDVGCDLLAESMSTTMTNDYRLHCCCFCYSGCHLVEHGDDLDGSFPLSSRRLDIRVVATVVLNLENRGKKQNHSSSTCFYYSRHLQQAQEDHMMAITALKRTLL